MSILSVNDVIQGMRRPSAIAGIAGLAALTAGYVVADRTQFFHAYLMGYLFVLAFAAGSLGFLMIHHLAGGRWTYVLQRPFEAAARTLPALAILFIPIVLGMSHLYTWSDPAAVHADPVLEHAMHTKAAYLNVPFFLARAAIYFVVWIALAFALSNLSRRQDGGGEKVAIDLKMRKISGIGLLLFGLTATFASFDWVMSLEPKWYSSIFGAVFMVEQGLAALCLMAIVAHRLARTKPFGDVITQQQFHDIGNMMFALTILWTYMVASQYIIIWSGNLPEEIEYYLHRSVGGWPIAAGILAVLHFAVPFVLMLFKSNKKRSQVLVRIAALLLVVRVVDFLWVCMPSFRHHFSITWLDVASFVGFTGLWMILFLRNLAAAPVLPQHDPRFESVLAHPEVKDEGWEADASDA